LMDLGRRQNNARSIELYPTNEVQADKIAAWYAETSGLNRTDEGSSSVLSHTSENLGRIEVLRETSDKVRLHLAIYVSNFEESCRILKNKLFELEEPTIKRNIKSAYLKKPDPAGNRIHPTIQGPAYLSLFIVLSSTTSIATRAIQN